jgi:hypothetical protein
MQAAEVQTRGGNSAEVTGLAGARPESGMTRWRYGREGGLCGKTAGP